MLFHHKCIPLRIPIHDGIDSCQLALDLNIMFVRIIRNEIHAKRYQK